MSYRVLEPLELYPQGAPGALGNDTEDRPTLTPYLPDAPGRPTAAMIVCPGGGYSFRSDHESGPVCQWLCGLGIAGVLLDYRVKPYRHPAPLHDAQRGIRLTRHHAERWNVDPGRVGILGFSAGGHLAISAATIFDDGEADAPDPANRLPSRPDALVACYPVVTFGEHRHDGSMKALLGPEPEPGLRGELSLENRVTRKTPPTFLWHTAEDAAVPVENSLLLAGALSREGVPFALHVYPRGSHGLGVLKDPKVCGQWMGACETWLEEAGFAGGC